MIQGKCTQLPITLTQNAPCVYDYKVMILAYVYVF